MQRSSSNETPQSDIVSPVTRYYLDFVNQNPSTFDSFARQSRSRLVHDIYARAASNGNDDIYSLLMKVEDRLILSNGEARSPGDLEYKAPILLSLASYLIDTAESDLDFYSGLQLYRFVLAVHGDVAFSEQHQMRFLEALGSHREFREQKSLCDVFNLQATAPVQADLMEIDRLAHEGSHESWLQAMNAFYAARGMHTIGLKDNRTLPLLDRLTSNPEHKIEGPLISVIVPTFSPSERIYTAIESLLHQTWVNLEIIVVDDGSPATFESILNNVEALDHRIRVIRRRENRGAYSARNVGLEEANGAYVTTHDDDDWSHPDKLATQASILLSDESVVAITAGHIRATSELRFRRINTRPGHLQTNFSSLMFRRKVTDYIGGWDTSKRGSDTEFVSRIRAHYGKTSLVKIEDKPLSFSRVWDGSLTAGEIYRGYLSHSRRLYGWAYQHWHREAKRQKTGPFLEPYQGRPFAIPTAFNPSHSGESLGLFDIIYLTDYSRSAKYSDSVLRDIRTAAESGLRVGFMQMDSPQTIKRTTVITELFDSQLAGLVTQISETDYAETKLMVIYDAAIGMFMDRVRSRILVRRGVVVHDVGPVLRSAKHRRASHPLTVLRHVDKAFGTPFKIVGTSLQEQRELRHQVPSGRLLSDELIWFPYLIASQDCSSAPPTDPVIGFHSFGNKYRWPSTREIFNLVYRFRDKRTMLYGNVNPVTKALGEEILEQIQVVKPTESLTTEFLRRIDFWAYFPHEDLDSRPWLPVLEALQAGKIVILPPQLKETYGSGAVYCEPKDVGGLVDYYAKNAIEFSKQVERGQSFVEASFSQTAHLARLHTLLLSAEPRSA